MKNADSKNFKKTKEVSRQQKSLPEDFKLILKKRVPGMSLKLNKIRIGLVKIFSKTENIFLLLAIPALLVIAHITPIGWGLDEAAHVSRVYQISEGITYPIEIEPSSFGGSLPSNLFTALKNSKKEVKGFNSELPFYSRQDLKDPKLNDELLSKPLNDNQREEVEFGPTGPYNPFVYAAAALGFFMSRILDLNVGQATFVARVMQAAFFVFCGYLALRLLSKTKLRWLLFSVMLLPAVAYQVVTINADSFTLAVTFLYFASLSSLFLMKRKATKHELLILSLSALGMALTKPSYAMFVALILFLPQASLGGGKMAAKFKLAFTGGAFLPFLLFSVKGMSYVEGTYRPLSLASSMNFSEQLHFMVFNGGFFLRVLCRSVIMNVESWSGSFIGHLGYSAISPPYPAFILAWITLAGASVYGAKDLSKRVARYFVASGLVSMLSVAVVLYGTFNVIGSGQLNGIQGRYFIPSGLFIFAGLGALLPVSLKFKPFGEYKMFVGASAIILYSTLYVYVYSVL